MEPVRLVATLRDALRDERGAALAEYALIAASVGISMIAGVALLQTESGSALSNNAAGWKTVAISPP